MNGYIVGIQWRETLERDAAPKMKNGSQQLPSERETPDFKNEKSERDARYPGKARAFLMMDPD